MGDVSQNDDADRPEQQPGHDAAPARPDDAPAGPADERDLSDTQPLGSSYPPPLPGHPESRQAPQQPGPYGQPYGGPQPTSTYPTQPQPSYAYPTPAPQGQPAAGDRGTRLPAWAWPVITVVALVV